MAFERKFLFLFAIIVLSCAKGEAKKSKVTRIQFYMHDTIGGPNVTAVQVASPTNSTAPNMGFGSLFVMDNPLTALPISNSTLVGRAQGIYAISSQQPNDFSLHMSFTIGFLSGPYKGSTISVLGRNPVMNTVREFPIVGGTGMFRIARGYCLARTHSMNQVVAVIGYNMTVIHY